jgi:hypothetical protein
VQHLADTTSAAFSTFSIAPSTGSLTAGVPHVVSLQAKDSKGNNQVLRSTYLFTLLAAIASPACSAAAGLPSTPF